MHTAIQKCFTLTLALRSLLSLCNQQQKVSFRTSCETLSSGKDTFDDDNLFVHLYNSFKDHNSASRKRCTASALCIFEILGQKYFAIFLFSDSDKADDHESTANIRCTYCPQRRDGGVLVFSPTGPTDHTWRLRTDNSKSGSRKLYSCTLSHATVVIRQHMRRDCTNCTAVRLHMIRQLT